MSPKHNKGEWTPEEQSLFLEAIDLYKKDWDRITEHIGTRSKQQVQSHAQKYNKHLDDVKRRNELLNYWADAQDRSKRIRRTHKYIDYSIYSGVQRRSKSKALRKSKSGDCSAFSTRDSEIVSEAANSPQPIISSVFSMPSDLNKVSSIMESGYEGNPIRVTNQLTFSPNVQPAIVADTSRPALPASFFANISFNSQLYCTSIPMYSVYHYGAMSLPQSMYPGPTVI